MRQLIDSIRMAGSALAANKMRAVLTTLGVVIGITTVLIMGWALNGLDTALEQTLAIMGDDILYIDKYQWGSGNWREQRNRKQIDFRQYEKLHERLETAEYIVPTADRYGRQIRYQSLELSSSTILGTTADYIGMLKGNMGSGRFFSPAEAENGALVTVLGYNIVQNLFGNTDPVGRTVYIEGLPFTVIGTMPKRGALFVDFVDNQVLIPIKRYFNLYGRRGRGITINVKAGGVERLEDVRYEAIGVMREIRSLAPGEDNDFGVNSQEQFREQTDQLRAAVWGVGIVMTGLSFLVGSIGIMNIMFVSVTERTKEIGIRKAVGARRSTILLQFLVESVMLCMMGAVIGLLLTSALAYGVYAVWEVEYLSPTVPPSQIGVGILVAVIVGVLAGIIPAFRAARLDPVDALRAE